MINKFFLYIKKHRWLSFSALVLLVCFIAILLKYLTPTNVVEQKVSFSIPFETTKDVSFVNTVIEKDSSFVSPTLPPTLTVYTAQNVVISSSQLLRSFISPQVVTNGIWKDNASLQALAFNPYGKEYIFEDAGSEGDFDASGILIVNLKDSLETALTYIKTTLGLSGYTPLLDQVVYFKKDNPQDEGALIPATEANSVSIPFTQNIGGYSYFSEQHLYAPITITVDSTNKITQAKVAESLSILKQPKLVQTQPLDEALKKLNLARILRISTNDELGFNFDSAIKLTLQHATVEYRSSSTNQLVLPWYNIQAEALIKDTATPITIDFLLPAVPLEIQTQQ